MRTWPRSECPRCGAKSGEACRAAYGTVSVRKPHKARPVGPLGGVTKPITRQMETFERANTQEGT